MTCPSQSLWATPTAWSTATQERPWATPTCCRWPTPPSRGTACPLEWPTGPRVQATQVLTHTGLSTLPGTPDQSIVSNNVHFHALLTSLESSSTEDHQQLHRGYENTPRMNSNTAYRSLHTLKYFFQPYSAVPGRAFNINTVYSAELLRLSQSRKKCLSRWEFWLLVKELPVVSGQIKMTIFSF